MDFNKKLNIGGLDKAIKQTADENRNVPEIYRFLHSLETEPCSGKIDADKSWSTASLLVDWQEKTEFL